MITRKYRLLIIGSSITLLACSHLYAADAPSDPKRTHKTTKSRKAASSTSPEKKARNEARPEGATAETINPQTLDAQRLSNLVFSATNEERTRAGLPQFRPSSALANAATRHSADMAARDYFSHKSGTILNRADVMDRVAGAGAVGTTFAENIAMFPVHRSWRTVTRTVNGRPTQVTEMDTYTYQSMAAGVVQQWMESPGHRRNILNGALTTLGVGIGIGNHDGVPYIYFTQNFSNGS